MASILFRSFFLSFKSISRNLHGKKANRNHKEISKFIKILLLYIASESFFGSILIINYNEKFLL